MRLILLCAFQFTAAVLAVAEEPRGVLAEYKDGKLLLTEAAKPVLAYQVEPKSLDGKFKRANYLHPLYDLDGNVITEDFPEDHRHHRGIFWAWHQVLVEGKKMGDAWEARDFVWKVKPFTGGPHGGSLVAIFGGEVWWSSPALTDDNGEMRPFIKEITTISVHPSDGETRKIDFNIRLLALHKNVRIGGSEDDKGYGGFSARLRLPKDVQFAGRNGPIKPKRTAVEAGPWIDVSGTFGLNDRKSGVTILCHPTLPGFPQPWILRSSRSMQNAAYPGREAVALSTKNALVLRYRLVLHRGPVTAETITKWQAEYAATDG